MIISSFVFLFWDSILCLSNMGLYVLIDQLYRSLLRGIRIRVVLSYHGYKPNTSCYTASNQKLLNDKITGDLYCKEFTGN